MTAVCFLFHFDNCSNSLRTVLLYSACMGLVLTLNFGRTYISSIKKKRSTSSLLSSWYFNGCKHFPLKELLSGIWVQHAYFTWPTYRTYILYRRFHIILEKALFPYLNDMTNAALAYCEKSDESSRSFNIKSVRHNILWNQGLMYGSV